MRGTVPYTDGVVSISTKIGRDLSDGDRHIMYVPIHKGDQNCGEIRRSLTKLIVLETGLYDGAPASKVLLLPVTGEQLESL